MKPAVTGLKQARAEIRYPRKRMYSRTGVYTSPNEIPPTSMAIMRGISGGCCDLNWPSLEMANLPSLLR